MGHRSIKSKLKKIEKIISKLDRGESDTREILDPYHQNWDVSLQFLDGIWGVGFNYHDPDINVDHENYSELSDNLYFLIEDTNYVDVSKIVEKILRKGMVFEDRREYTHARQLY